MIVPPVSSGAERQIPDLSSPRVTNHQAANQTKPKLPTAAKDHRQPTTDESPSTITGATSAPMLVPLVNTPLPIARSFGGRARETIRSAPGQFADSATPSNVRNAIRLANPPANPVAPATSDHKTTASP